MSDRRVVVTGGAGFIGSHLVDALLARGIAVSVFDNLSTGNRENVSAEASLICADVRDVDTLASALAGADGVFHLAARVSVRDSMDNFADDADTNLLGTIRMLQACAIARPRRLILASSMAVYADSPNPTPVAETYQTVPLSAYGLSKLSAEKYCLHIGPRIGVEPVVLRFFNTYGTRQTDTPYVGVISIFVRRLLDGKPPTVFGDGMQCRDFVHVSDIVSANVAALDAPEAAGAVLNIGTGRSTSVNAIANLLCDRIAPYLRPCYAPAQPGELRNCIADITAARRVLSYEAPAGLHGNIDEVIEHLRARAPLR